MIGAVIADILRDGICSRRHYPNHLAEYVLRETHTHPKVGISPLDTPRPYPKEYAMYDSFPATPEIDDAPSGGSRCDGELHVNQAPWLYCSSHAVAGR